VEDFCCKKPCESGNTDADTRREARLHCATQVNEAHDDDSSYIQQVSSECCVGVHGRLCLCKASHTCASWGAVPRHAAQRSCAQGSPFFTKSRKLKGNRIHVGSLFALMSLFADSIRVSQWRSSDRRAGRSPALGACPTVLIGVPSSRRGRRLEVAAY
jgi:hypothetical protein